MCSAVSTASSRVPVMDDFVLNITCPSGLSSIRDCNLTRITNAACSEANQANGDAEVAYSACGGEMLKYGLHDSSNHYLILLVLYIVR